MSGDEEVMAPNGPVLYSRVAYQHAGRVSPESPWVVQIGGAEVKLDPSYRNEVKGSARQGHGGAKLTNVNKFVLSLYHG